MIFDLLYPSVCPHCDGSKERGFLCSLCSEDIDLNDDDPKLPPSLLNDATYTLELEGANSTLYRMFQREHTYLTDPLSNLMHIKYLKMNWPKMDYIVPLHKTPFYRHHPDLLLKKGMDRLLKPNGDKNGTILIVSTLFEWKKLEEKAILLSAKLPEAIYSLSLWNLNDYK